jgi:hypothetical protein
MVMLGDSSIVRALLQGAGRWPDSDNRPAPAPAEAAVTAVSLTLLSLIIMRNPFQHNGNCLQLSVSEGPRTHSSPCSGYRMGKLSVKTKLMHFASRDT